MISFVLLWVGRLAIISVALPIERAVVLQVGNVVVTMTIYVSNDVGNDSGLARIVVKLTARPCLSGAIFSG